MPFSFDPRRSGTGSFSYNVPGNNTPESRSANLTVSFAGGGELYHTITQERPSCSYMTSPAELSFSSAGGTGAIDVVTTPDNCMWIARALYDFYGVVLTSGASGTGGGRVTYRVNPNTSGGTRESSVTISGLSGQNPPGVHQIHIAR
jgi:hypothetical protein